uniref:TPT domain-containing protein n=1 Tax=Heterorhabditis bacteriophora TaxID=37862 RepID=A0A1I7WWW6_HETBA
MANTDKFLTRNERYMKIFVAIASYWWVLFFNILGFSIGLVFLNKYLLSSSNLKLDAPLFITWYQCIITVILCFALSALAKIFPHTITFPHMSLDQKISREVLPLSVIFVAMITFNNLCLKYVGVSFYYVGRSLTTVFNVVCSYMILGQKTSAKALGCCLLIIVCKISDVSRFKSIFSLYSSIYVIGSLSVLGFIYGVLASLFVALNAIYTQRSLGAVGDSIWRLTMYNNLNASFLFLPLMLFSGEFGEVIYFPKLFDFVFWMLMTLSGFLGFMMGYVTGWQIQATSPLTHNISGTAKAAAQTVLAVVWWQELKTSMWSVFHMYM